MWRDVSVVEVCNEAGSDIYSDDEARLVAICSRVNRALIKEILSRGS